MNIQAAALIDWLTNVGGRRVSKLKEREHITFLKTNLGEIIGLSAVGLCGQSPDSARPEIVIDISGEYPIFVRGGPHDC